MNTLDVTGYVPGSPRLAYHERGEGDAVVFLHGIGGNRHQWFDQAGPVGRTWRFIAWDARGYGASDDYEGALDFGTFSADLIRLLDHLKIGKAHLVGLSMGARILLDFAPRFSGRVVSLTLCDFFFGFGTALSKEKQDEFIALRRKPLQEGRTLSDLAPALVDSLLSASAASAVRDRLIASIESLHQESYLKTLDATVRYDRSANLSQITAPVQMIYGTDDRLTPPSIGEAVREVLPAARLNIIAGAGHLSNMEAPDAFNRILLDFLGSLATAATPKTVT